MTVEAKETALDDEQDAEVVLEGTLVCALTGEHKVATPHEETVQSFIEQLHREYGVELADMARDLRVECITGEEGGKPRKTTRTVQLAVYEHGNPPSSRTFDRAAVGSRASRPTEHGCFPHLALGERVLTRRSDLETRAALAGWRLGEQDGR